MTMINSQHLVISHVLLLGNIFSTVRWYPGPLHWDQYSQHGGGRFLDGQVLCEKKKITTFLREFFPLYKCLMFLDILMRL